MYIKVLAIIGFLALGITSALIVILVIQYVKDKIEDLKYWYRYKHRFDKPPIAKCYCFDCIHHDNNSGRCYAFHEDSNRLTADNCFCYRAEPKKKNSEKI